MTDNRVMDLAAYGGVCDMRNISLSWVFAHGLEVLSGDLPGGHLQREAIEVLADSLCCKVPGWGYRYMTFTRALLEEAEPFLLAGDADGWQEWCDVIGERTIRYFSGSLDRDDFYAALLIDKFLGMVKPGYDDSEAQRRGSDD